MISLNKYELNCLKEIVDLVCDLEKTIIEELYQGFELTHSQREALECVEILSKGGRVP